jgi:hypothetical protein
MFEDKSGGLETLMPGRERLAADEARPLVVLFAREHFLATVMRRG